MVDIDPQHYHLFWVWFVDLPLQRLAVIIATMWKQGVLLECAINFGPWLHYYIYTNKYINYPRSSEIRFVSKYFYTHLISCVVIVYQASWCSTWFHNVAYTNDSWYSIVNVRGWVGPCGYRRQQWVGWCSCVFHLQHLSLQQSSCSIFG